MDKRIHAALEGELPLDDLTDAERARVAAFEARVSELRNAVGARTPAGVPDHVMRRIRELGIEPVQEAADRSTLHRLGTWLWRPRSLQLRWRPAYALAAALAATVLVIASPITDRFGATTRATTASEPGGDIYVQFRFQTQDASTVALAGSFSDWQPTYALHETAPGVWTAVLPLPPGVHDYAFVVDGERWVADPAAPHVDDGFGGVNSRLALLEPAARQ